jgi:hypothetical protein
MRAHRILTPAVRHLRAAVFFAQGGAMGNVVGAIGASRFLSGMASMMGTAATAQQQQQPAASSYDVSV